MFQGPVNNIISMQVFHKANKRIANCGILDAILQFTGNQLFSRMCLTLSSNNI